MAVISLSAARRLNPRSTPTSTAIGTVSTNMLGSMSATMAVTVPKELILRMMSSRMWPRRGVNSTNVNSRPPSRACEKISRRMYRLRIRIGRQGTGQP